MEFEWNPSSGTDTNNLLNYLRETVTLNSLGFIWYSNPNENDPGIDPRNHGFDICSGFTGYYSDHVGKANSH